MRIAYLLGQFPVLSETFIGAEIRAVEAMGHCVFPIALHRPLEAFQQEDLALAQRTFYFSAIDKMETQRLVKQYQSEFHRIIPFALSQTTESYFPMLVHAAQSANHMKENRCTHVHAHFGWGATTYAIAAAKLLGIPVTFTCHGSDVYARPQDLMLKCKAAQAVFGVAPSITSTLQELAPEISCHVVSCGVDLTRFKPVQDTAQKHARWLFVGRLIDCKGVDDILKAWHLLPLDIRPQLDIVGDGPLKEALILYTKQHRLESHIRFLGPKGASWIAENGPHYCAFISAFKQGIDGSKDTAPLVLKEAMAMALPIVTTDFMDIPDMVDGRCAVLCPVASPDAIAAVVGQLQKYPPQLLQEMGEAGRIRAEKYHSLEQQAEKTTELFRFYGQ